MELRDAGAMSGSKPNTMANVQIITRHAIHERLTQKSSGKPSCTTASCESFAQVDEKCNLARRVPKGLMLLLEDCRSVQNEGARKWEIRNQKP